MTLPTNIAEIQQPRSDFQIRAWVIGQHDTDPMRYYQCCIELQGALHTYRNAELELRKSTIEAARLRTRRRGLLRRRDPVAQIDADIIDLGRQQTELAMIGARRELDTLHRIYSELPHFTRVQIEADQPTYWKARLHRQGKLQVTVGSLGWAHLEAMGQADTLDEFVAQVSAAEESAAVTGGSIGALLTGPAAVRQSTLEEDPNARS